MKKILSLPLTHVVQSSRPIEDNILSVYNREVVQGSTFFSNGTPSTPAYTDSRLIEQMVISTEDGKFYGMTYAPKTDTVFFDLFQDLGLPFTDSAGKPKLVINTDGDAAHRTRRLGYQSAKFPEQVPLLYPNLEAFLEAAKENPDPLQ